MEYKEKLINIMSNDKRSAKDRLEVIFNELYSLEDISDYDKNISKALEYLDKYIKQNKQ